MPEPEVVERARKDKEEGKSPSTQAGEFVREEMHHIREGKHGAQSTQQAIAIGLSKARRAGVKLPVPAKGRVSDKTRGRAIRDSGKAKRRGTHRPSRVRSRATSSSLQRESHSAASKKSLSIFARKSAKKRGHHSLHQSAMKAARTRRSRKRH